MEPVLHVRSGARQRLIEIGEQVVDMLNADRQSHGFLADAGLAQFVGRKLAVRGGSRVGGERFGVADIDEPREQAQRVLERRAGCAAALHAERQDVRISANVISDFG